MNAHNTTPFTPTTQTTEPDGARSPGWIGRLRSRQAGNPSGLLGRFIGRAMVKDTAGHNDRAIELLELTEPATLLEVGFGQGRTASRLVRGGHRVLGVDASPTMVAQGRARNRRAVADGRADLVLGDGLTLPFPDGSAENALTVHTVYFVPDLAATLAEISRVLRPGGRLVIACHVGDDPMPDWMDPSVYRIPTIEDVTRSLRKAGFSTVTRESDGSAYPTYWFVADLPSHA